MRPPTATAPESSSRRGRRTAGEDAAPATPAAAYPPEGYRDMIHDWALNATTWTMVNAGMHQPHPAWSPRPGTNTNTECTPPRERWQGWVPTVE